MIPGFSFDILHLVLAIVSFAVTGFYLVERTSAGRLRRRLLDAEEEMIRIRTAGKGPETREFRVERFDVLWFPVVTFRSAVREAVSAAAGVPHCKACVVPLSSSGGRSAWGCPKCGAQFPESLVDLSTTDMVAAEAMKWFLERNKGFRASAPVSRGRH